MIPGDPVVGSTILRRPAIQSPNYVAATSGWSIRSDGSAEFNNLTIRGTFDGTDFIITTTGAYFYSGPPAVGNLIISVTTAAGTDPEGNTVPSAGVVVYESANAWAALNAGILGFNASSGQVLQATVGPAAGTPGSVILASGTTGAGDSGAQIELLSANAHSGSSFMACTAQLVQLDSAASFTIPFNSAGITSVAQVVAALKNVGIFS